MEIIRTHQEVLKVAKIFPKDGKTGFCENSKGILPSCEGHTRLILFKELSFEQEEILRNYNESAKNFGSIDFLVEESSKPFSFYIIHNGNEKKIVSTISGTDPTHGNPEKTILSDPFESFEMACVEGL